MKTSPDKQSAFTVGVFTAELIDSYQASLLQGIIAAAGKKGMCLVSFLGSRIDSPIPQEASSNAIYRMATKKNIDGLIIISSAISTYLEYNEVIGLFGKHENIPRVSVGLEIPRIPSITVDGREGLGFLIQHLITDHNRRHFACIAGPRGHKESETRKKVIQSTLECFDLTMDPDLVVHGTFEKESGKKAVNALMETQKEIDALICLNDKMALAAMEELFSRGYHIPDDISVIGFDGLEEAECSAVPLTTVRQPLSEIGAAAISAICNLMEKGTAENRTLKCTPVLGGSCGCRKRLVPTEQELTLFQASMTEKDMKFQSRMKSCLLSHKNRKSFSEITKLIEESQIPLKRMHTILCLIQSEIAAASTLDNQWWEIVTHAFTQIADAENRRNAVQRLSLTDRFAVARSVGVSLSEAFEFPVILNRLNNGLDRLGFSKAFIVLFDEKKELQDTPGREGTVYKFPLSKETAAGYRGIRFSTDYILPSRLENSLKKGAWILVPLVFQTEFLGYLILPAHAGDSAIYDALSKQIASTLKGTQLLDKVRLHEKNLEKEVGKRTSELTKEISRRIRLEQEVIDISNNTMNRIGQDLHDDLCQHLAGISMITTALQKTFPESEHSYAVAGQINDLIVESIDRTKGIVRGLVPPGLEDQGLGVAVEALTEAVSRSYRIPIQFHKDELFDIKDEDTSLQIYRIIQEALSNSVKHSGCTAIQVQLLIDNEDGSAREPSLLVKVRDNGKGLPETKQIKGMGLKIMRYRAEKANAVLSFDRNIPEGGTVVTCRIS